MSQGEKSSEKVEKGFGELVDDDEPVVGVGGEVEVTNNT